MPPKPKPPRIYTQTHWLAKAEPDTRIEKGHDVSFSAHEFERVKVTSWEGVRNHQAKGYLKDGMQIDHPVLIYASNTKTPGISALSKVIRSGYPDHNAWDPKHPYYDPKSSPTSLTWYMVDLEFVSHLTHFVPLALLQFLAKQEQVPDWATYLEKKDLEAIREMPLLKRARLSVQPVERVAFEAVCKLAREGGWEGRWEREKKGKGKGVKKGNKEEEEEEEEQEEEEAKEEEQNEEEKDKKGGKGKGKSASKKRTKVAEEVKQEEEAVGGSRPKRSKRG